MAEFDGMERMIVFAIALDNPRSLDSCSEIYRAITRSQMYVIVIQQHVAGGWLEYLATLRLRKVLWAALSCPALPCTKHTVAGPVY